MALMPLFPSFSWHRASVRLVAAVTMAGLALLLATGCTPESRNSLPEQYRSEPDPRFIGVWQAEMLGADYRAEVSPGENGRLRLRLVETYRFSDRAAQQSVTTHDMAFLRLGDQTVMALKGPGLEPGDGPVYRFATYRFGTPDSVALFFLSEKAIDFEVRSEQFAGRIRSPDPTFPDMVLTEPAGRIAAFMVARDPESIFTVTFGPFQRRPS